MAEVFILVSLSRNRRCTALWFKAASLAGDAECLQKGIEVSQLPAEPTEAERAQHLVQGQAWNTYSTYVIFLSVQCD